MFKLIQLAILILAVYWFGRRLLQKFDLLDDSRKRTIPSPADDDHRDPHEILGVKRGVSESDLRQAYQTQIRKYHPDYLENMAPELRRLAEQRTKEINRAYETLSKQLSS